jgi:integrase
MLCFLIFIDCHTNEAVDGHWSEIDRPDSTWTIPGERMKMKQDHYVAASHISIVGGRSMSAMLMPLGGNPRAGRDFRLLFGRHICPGHRTIPKRCSALLMRRVKVWVHDIRIFRRTMIGSLGAYGACTDGHWRDALPAFLSKF